MTNHLNRITRVDPEGPYDLALWALVLDVSPLLSKLPVGTDAVAVQALLTGRPPRTDNGDQAQSLRDFLPRETPASLPAPGVWSAVKTLVRVLPAHLVRVALFRAPT